MVSVTNILKGELIGRNTKATQLKGGVAFTGTIIDETKNTIVLMTGKGRKALVKNQHVFHFKEDGKIIKIDGKLFAKRPEERVKTRLKKNG